MLKFILLIFSGIFLIPYSWSQTINEDHELLWEISGNGLQSNSYLFGSLHSNDRRLFNLTDSTYFALNEANVISLETDVFSMFETLDTRVSYVDLNYDRHGNPYAKHSETSETLYGNENGMPQFLDAYFQQYCLNAKKEFYPLETVEFQLSVFSDIQFSGFGDLNFSSLLTSKNEMIDLYLQGDIRGLDQSLKGSLSMYAGGYQELIIDRNIGMCRMLDSMLQKEDKKVFCAVGAGHLSGPQGMINLLRGKGYSVRKVMASYSDEKSLFENEFKAIRNYTYFNETLNLNVIFPGKPQVLKDEWEDKLLGLIYRDFGQGNSYEIDVYFAVENTNLMQLAESYIYSPDESPAQLVILEDGSEAVEGISDQYVEGIYWVRILKNEEYIFVLKAGGGSKFLNSKRAQNFFNKVQIK